MTCVVSKHDADSLPVGPLGNTRGSTEFAGSAGLVVREILPNEAEGVVAKLSPESLTNVIMAGLVLDNGLASPLNRGRFYGCYNHERQLEGIALIGHTVLFDAFSAKAIQAFATYARSSSPHLLMGESESVRQFWNYYAQSQSSPRHVCPIKFLHAYGPFPCVEPALALRPATPDDLELLVLAHAEMALNTSGVDPTKKDPAGFRERYLRRIAHGRVWVLITNGKLIFKADVLAETTHAAYIEGVYVSPEHRRLGIGSRCVSELGNILLRRSRAIYLFVENQHPTTQTFYEKLGFEVAGQYDLLYF